jgi:phospholipid/cholesterol/gamma-HCH transport system substrate-binding protein
MSSSAKVGLLVIVFVTLLVSGLGVMGKSLFREKTDTYYGIFKDASGVRAGAKVTMAGVPVGVVSKVELDSASLAKATLELKKGIQIPTGSTLSVAASLIGVGETTLAIVSPTTKSGAYLTLGGQLPGAKASPIDGILPEVKDTVAELNKTLIAFRTLVEDKKLRSGVDELLASSSATLTKFGRVADRIELTLAQNQGDIRTVMQTATGIVNDVKTTSKAIAALAGDGKVRKDLESIMAGAHALEQRADQLMVSIDKLVNDPKLREPMAKTVANFEKISESGTRIAANTEKMVKDGTEVSANAIQITEKVKVIADKAIELEDQLKALLAKAEGVVKKGVEITTPRITSQMDLIRETNPGYWRTDINLSLPIGSNSTLNAGLFDAFNTNKLNLQFGKTVSSNLTYRYGIYASKPSLGVDYRLAPRMSVRGDVWDINNPRFDLRARYEFGNGLLGWFGFDRVFDRNAFTFGLGVRR